MANAPQLFASNQEALGLVALGVIERTSSLIIHFAWGYLCFMAAYHRKPLLFLIALPMGLIDFFVPFATSSIILFEVLFMALALASVLIAWFITKDLRKKQETQQMERTN
jgi:uncharacterized membrane protein YhfC